MFGSVKLAIRSTEREALAVQLVELVPSGHGNVIEALDAEAEPLGGRFGGGGGVLRLRWPAQNWKMKPFGSSENLKPFGTPFVVAGLVVPGTMIIPLPGTKTPERF